MVDLKVKNTTENFNSYRDQRVKSLFNAQDGSTFECEVKDVDLDWNWTIGVIVGPSGSGKTSLGHKIFKDGKIDDLYSGWHNDRAIVDDIAPDGSFDAVTGALANVGLGDVPAWLRNFNALSNGQKFRAGLARLVVNKPDHAVIDEFTSVIDRQVAKIGSKALSKAWRRNNEGQQIVLLTPHYDILDWLQPDWVIDTKNYKFEKRCASKPPRIELQIIKTDSRYWHYFKPHYYLDLPEPIASEHFIGTVNGELACHVVSTPMFQCHAYRLTRLVTMPEWQGAGVGMRFLNWVAEYHLEGHGRQGRKYPVIFHTSHPQLINALRHNKCWRQTGAKFYDKPKRVTGRGIIAHTWIGNLRAIQAFKYYGARGGGRAERVELDES